jgi:hypothetical protein
MWLVFIKLSVVNVSVIVPVLITDRCVSLGFSMVQTNSPICVSDSFFSFSMKQHHFRWDPLSPRQRSILRLRLEDRQIGVSSDERLYTEWGLGVRGRSFCRLIRGHRSWATRVEVQSSSGHTNRLSTLESMEERSDELSYETVFPFVRQQTSYNIRIFQTTIYSQIYR